MLLFIEQACRFSLNLSRVGLMEAISSFSRKDALKTWSRSAEIYGYHFLNCSPAQLIFHARPSIVSHSHLSRSSRSKDSRSYLGPLPVTRLELTQSRALPCFKWQQTEAGAIRCRLGIKKCSRGMEC